MVSEVRRGLLDGEGRERSGEVMNEVIITANKSMALIKLDQLKKLMDEFENAMATLARTGGAPQAVNAAGDNLVECVMDNRAKILAAIELADVYMVWHKGNPLGESAGNLLAKARAYEDATKVSAN